MTRPSEPEWYPDDLTEAAFGTFSETERHEVWLTYGALHVDEIGQRSDGVTRARAVVARFGVGDGTDRAALHRALSVLAAKMGERHGGPVELDLWCPAPRQTARERVGTHARRRARVARARGETPRGDAARDQLRAALAAYDRAQAALPPVSSVSCCLSCAGFGHVLDAQDRRRAWIAILARKVGDQDLARAAEVGAL